MTATDLEGRWAARDRLYGERKTHGESALTPEEVQGVIAWRTREADDLPGLERTKALTKLANWISPRGRRF